MENLKKEYGHEEDFADYNVENQETGNYTNAKGGAMDGGFPNESQKYTGRVLINK